MPNVTEILDAHVPSITDADEKDMDQVLANGAMSWDYADLARRTCSCGHRTADFYDYHDHLKAVFETLIT